MLSRFESRDARFDGLLFVGVTSTGIYCRPVCPARTPKFDIAAFLASAAAAQEAGFRPCLRCRPETAPDLASWRGTSNTVSRALALITDGALDGDGATSRQLAERLGLGEPPAPAIVFQHLGASPIAVAQTRRVLFAKQLIHETRMPMTEVALAAGFGSLRRFNEIFQDLFHRPPSALREEDVHQSDACQAGVTLRLRYRPPYDWDSMLAYLRARAIPGIEIVEDDSYRRTVEYQRLGWKRRGHASSSAAEPGVDDPLSRCSFSACDCDPRAPLFDLGADIETIDAHLSRDPLLAPLVAQRPGLRAPGGWDGFELAVRAILGQQVSVSAAARRLAGQLVALHGKPVPVKSRRSSRLVACLSSPRIGLSGQESIGLGMPVARQASFKGISGSCRG